MPQLGGEKYAESIINGRPEDFDGVEVHGVREEMDVDADHDTIHCEVDDDNPEFFSVYGHLVRGGVECFGDFPTKAEAEAYAAELLVEYEGWKLDPCSQPRQ